MQFVEGLIRASLKVAAVGLLLCSPIWFLAVASAAASSPVDPWPLWLGYAFVMTLYTCAHLWVSKKGIGTGRSLVLNSILAGAVALVGLLFVVQVLQMQNVH